MGCLRISNQGLELTHEVYSKTWRGIVDYLYRLESDGFFSQCHKNGGSVDDCIEDTVATFSPNAQFYSVTIHGKPAGFFVKTKHEGQLVMEGFHIAKEHRTAGVFSAFWLAVRIVFGEPYYIGVYSGNTPAIEHLKRNGFEDLGSIEIQGKMFNLLHDKLI